MSSESKAVERLRMASDLSLSFYGKPLTVCYSGGKDSQVLVRLALESGVPFTVRHSITTVDAPETIRTVRETFQRLESLGIETDMRHPGTTMWKLIPRKKMPPTRLVRYCCKYLKESGNAENDFIATGVRKAESRQRTGRGTLDVLANKKEKRKRFGDDVFLSNDNDDNRREIERCMAKNTMCVNPIIDWTDAEVFAYYWDECEVHNPLYSEGWHRVGCIGCPMGTTRARQREFARWPKYRDGYLRAFGKMLEARRAAGLATEWETPDEVMHWWLQDGYDPNQLEIEWKEQL